MATSEPRELTRDECRKNFLDHLDAVLRHILLEPRSATTEDKMRLMVFCTLVAIDGEAADLPPFDLIPTPHESDAEYRRGSGDNWWPTRVDIAGELHSQWARDYKPSAT